MGGLRLDELGDAETFNQREEVLEDVDLGETSDTDLQNEKTFLSLLHAEQGSTEIPNPALSIITTGTNSSEMLDDSIEKGFDSSQHAQSPPRPVNTTSASVSPIPSVRGGLVVIPEMASHLAISMRAESGSPYRALPPTILPASFPDIAQDAHVVLTQLNSSPKPRIRQHSTGSYKTASGLPTLKSAKPSTLTRTAATKSSFPPDHNAKLTIRGQLDNAFVGRLGPPQRSTFGFTTSSVSTTSRAPSAERVKAMPLAHASKTSVFQRKIPSPPLDPKHSDTAATTRTPLVARAIPLPTQSLRRHAPMSKVTGDLPTAGTVRPLSPSKLVPAKRASVVAPLGRSLVSNGGPSRTPFGSSSRIVPSTHNVLPVSESRGILKSPARKRCEGAENQMRRVRKDHRFR